MKIPLYHLWSDTYFYIYILALAGSLAFLVYAIRRWLELKNAAPYEEEPGEEAPAALPQHIEFTQPAEENPEAAPQELRGPEKTVVVPNIDEMMAQASEEAAQAFSEEPAPEQEAAPAQAAAPEFAPEPGEAQRPAPTAQDAGRAEEYVKGIYSNISGIEARLGAIEESIAKGGSNRHFAVKFLEGLLEDYDSMSIGKIKARIEYLITDLKENQDRTAE